MKPLFLRSTVSAIYDLQRKSGTVDLQPKPTKGSSLSDSTLKRGWQKCISKGEDCKAKDPTFKSPQTQVPPNNKPESNQIDTTIV